jgi:hypothetical protein
VGARPTDADLWRGGIVPHEINPDLGNIVAVETAIKTLEQQTNVRFVGRYLQDDYIRFAKRPRGQRIRSTVGRAGASS